MERGPEVNSYSSSWAISYSLKSVLAGGRDEAYGVWKEDEDSWRTYVS